MNRGERARLEKLYRNKLASAVHSAVESADESKESGDLKAGLEQAETYAKLLALVETRWASDWIAAVLVAFCCLLAASLLWSLKVPKTDVSMTVETESLRGTLSQDWRVELPFQSSIMHFENLSDVQAPNLGLAIQGGMGDAWFKLEGGQINLESLQIDRGATLQMTVDNSQAGLFVTHKGVHGKLTVLGKGKLTGGTQPEEQTVRRDYNINVPETIEFGVRDPKGVPSRLTIHSPQMWNLGRIPLGDIGFALPEIRDLSETELISGIKSGSVRFSDTSWPVLDLAEGQIVSVHETQGTRIELRAGPAQGTAHLTMHGLVKDVTLGDARNRRQLSPSYLEYLYNKKSFTLFWGAIVFGWGVLWGIRKTIFR
jgi:hypothetical protein